tara:strand:+ start:388 stop:1110 length:723 start_codon:yes stop_codon:yes gene_type:complete
MIKANTEMELMVLCGGQGTRLKNVLNGKPKILALINNNPFISFLLKKFENEKVKKVIFCTGYKHEQVFKWVSQKYTGLINISFSKENEVLGTGGALLNALDKITSDNFIVINGDTLVDVDLKSIMEFHIQNNANATIGLFTADHEKDSYGSVTINKNNCVTSFSEKAKKNTENMSYINAGVYVFNKNFLSNLNILERPYSIEYELIPNSLSQNNIYGFVDVQKFYDIGTPFRLSNASHNI